MRRAAEAGTDFPGKNVLCIRASWICSPYVIESLYSLLVTGVIALFVIWLVMFVVRKLIGIALIATVGLRRLDDLERPDVAARRSKYRLELL